MKIASSLILLALALFIVSPLSIQIAPSDEGTFIVTLDVCHASGSAVSPNADMPAIDERPCSFQPVALAGFIETLSHDCRLYVPSFQLERPPRS